MFCVPVEISTHALTWSATSSSDSFSFSFFISTHALTWSATNSHASCVFQFRISTHALTWSATPFQMLPPKNTEFQLTHSRGVRRLHILHLFSDSNFNSRTHVECDATAFNIVRDGADFNSRTHVECDHTYYSRLNVVRNFNSRTHVECD